MKRLLYVIITLLAVIATVACVTVRASALTMSVTSSTSSNELLDRPVVIYDLQEIYDDPSILTNRTPDTIIVERCVGIVVDDSVGEGRLIYSDPYYNYIYYPEMFHTGDVVVTYNVYNPDNTYEDDVLYRFDILAGHLRCYDE